MRRSRRRSVNQLLAQEDNGGVKIPARPRPPALALQGGQGPAELRSLSSVPGSCRPCPWLRSGLNGALIVDLTLPNCVGLGDTRGAKSRWGPPPGCWAGRRWPLPSTHHALPTVRISSPAANSATRSRARTCTVWSATARRRISIHACVVVPEGQVLERLGIEVGVQLAVDDLEHVAVELGGHAGGVVVCGHQPILVLHEIGPEQQPIARPERRRPGRPGIPCERPGRGCRWCHRGTPPAGGLPGGASRGDARSRPPRRAPRCRGTRSGSGPPTRAGTARSRRRARSGPATRAPPWRRDRAGSSPRCPIPARRACRRRTPPIAAASRSRIARSVR